jgi:hypothetical protein
MLSTDPVANGSFGLWHAGEAQVKLRNPLQLAWSFDNLYRGVENMKHPNLRQGAFMTLASAVTFLSLVQGAYAQTKATPPAAAPKGAAAPAAKQGATTPPASLGQLMKGVIYPASNVVFAAQSEDPAKVKPAKDASLSTDPLASSYGGWQAVENAGLALSESANLLMIAGRKCANGVNVPLSNPDWPKFVQVLREAGAKVYKAAQAKSQDNILDAADAMTTACSNCHEKWREKPSLAERCK